MASRVLTRPVMVFALLGAAAGLVTATLALSELTVITVAAGLPLALALAVSMAIYRQKIGGAQSRARVLLALAMVAVAYPASVVTMVAALVGTDAIASRLLPLGVLHVLNPSQNPLLSFLVGLVVGAFLGASLMQVALWVLNRHWSTRVWLLFIVSGIGTALVAFAGHTLTQTLDLPEARRLVDPVFVFLLFPIGHSFFSLIFGYGAIKNTSSLKSSHGGWPR